MWKISTKIVLIDPSLTQLSKLIYYLTSHTELILFDYKNTIQTYKWSKKLMCDHNHIICLGKNQ